MASVSIEPEEVAAIIEADEDEATLTLNQQNRRVSLLNFGPDPIFLRYKAGDFVNDDPAALVQADGEAMIPSGQSHPLWSALSSIRYKTEAAGSAFFQMVSDTD